MPISEYETVLDSFYLLSREGRERFEPFYRSNNEFHICIPNNEDLKNLVPVFSFNGNHTVRVFCDTIELVSGKSMLNLSDFTKKTELRVECGENKEKWSLSIYNIPVLLINTPDSSQITSTKVRKEGCQISLIETNGNIINLGTAGIKGRGNSSWLQPKKPYNIKLDVKHELLGMNPSKNWVLLANAYFDRTQLHNATAFEMARLTDYPWVQSGEFVELIFNGVHQGLYYLCEKIDIGTKKINITEISPTDLDGENLTGGYLLESAVNIDLADKYFVTNYFNKTGRKFEYTLGWESKSPDKADIPYEQLNYLRTSMNEMEKLIWDEDSLKKGIYRNYFDIESAINWWLVQEASLNEEATRTKNMYLYKIRGGRFVVGPPWDFDAWTFGYYGTSHFYCTKTAFYYENLFKDPFFVSRLKEKWEIYRDLWKEKIPIFIDKQYNSIFRAALRNEKMWPDYCPESHATEESYEQSIINMKKAFITQLEWMDQSIENNYFTDWWDENDWPPSHR
jgi:hypothetical protein